jgi:hypothetical protein
MAGGSYGQTSQSSTGTSNTQNTFSPTQTATQDLLGTGLQTALASSNAGTLTPGVAAQKTAAASQINKTAAGTLDRTNAFLASRGFGKSGTAGKAALQTDLARQGALGANEANFADIQQRLNSQNLLAALNYAFTALGQTARGTSTGKSSGWGLNAGAGLSIPMGGGG